MDKSLPRLTIVIPHRVGESVDIAVDSLKLQTFQDFKIITVTDINNRGANWARNEGFKQCDTEYVLFSDNDIEWKSNALQTMIGILDRFPRPSYSYGRYKMNEVIWSHQPFWADLLRHHNYISTMSVWRAKDFPGFDENLKRLQDWDVYLTALEQGKRGIYCEDLVFETKIKPGITFDENLNPETSYLEAEDIVKIKHGLKQFTPPLPKR